MEKSFYLEFRKQKIYVRLGYPDTNKKLPGILFLHGTTNEGGLTNYSELFNGFKKNTVILMFNFLGCGKSDGNFSDLTIQDRLDQAEFIFDYFTKLTEVDSKNISVIGGSMGGHVAARLAGERNFKNLILRAPASYRKDFENVKMKPNWLPWDKEKKYWPRDPSLAFESIEKFRGNLLVVKHEKDEIIPLVTPQTYYEKAKVAKSRKIITLEGAPHKTSDKPGLDNKFVKIIEDFVRKSN